MPIPRFLGIHTLGSQVGTYTAALPPSLPGISRPRQEAPEVRALCLFNTLGSTSELCITALSSCGWSAWKCLLLALQSHRTHPKHSNQLCSSSPWRKPLISWADYFSSCPLKDEAQETRGRSCQRHHNGSPPAKPTGFCYSWVWLSLSWKPLLYNSLKRKSGGTGPKRLRRRGGEQGGWDSKAGNNVLSEKAQEGHIKVSLGFESRPFCSDIFNLFQSQTTPSLTFRQA